MNERRPVSCTLVPTKPNRRLVSALAGSVVVAVVLAGCSSGPSSIGEKSRTASVDPKLGVAPSPRVVAVGDKVPKGGGRAMVGKPYKVAGKKYVPHLDPNYSKVGLASWYGNAFHGRRTANGEIFDSEHLSAAHPTMPLPSYARVTSLTTGRSVVVRVNDRGPFHSNRLIDISRRTAEVIGVRSAGIAKVKVEYVGPAPTQGDDTEYLMASYRGPSDLPSSLPETMIASAEALPGVAMKATTSAAGAATGLFKRRAPKTETVAPTLVASADIAPEGPRIPGTVLPPIRPLYAEEVYVTVAVADPADAYFAAAETQVASLEQTGVTAVGYTQASFQVGAQPIDTDVRPPEPPVRRSYAEDRVSQAHTALDGIEKGVALSELARRLEALSVASRAPQAATNTSGPTLRIGFFANQDNANRVADRLRGLGVVSTGIIQVDGRALTEVRLSGLSVTMTEAVAAAEKAGAHGAQIIR